MAYRLEEEGKSGIINGAQFLAWGHLGFHWITIYHNIAGTLTESASAKLATPLYIHPSQLTGDRRGTLPTYDPQTNFPNPWPGGWWRLRDIVEQQKISAWAALDMAARNKDTALKNAYLKAKRQTKRGAKGSPAAYIIPCAQHDPLTMAKMVEKLLVQGIKVHVAKEEFIIDDVIYPAGSYVVDCAQPKSGLVKTLLGQTTYPDHPWTRARDGSPLRPQDTATDTMFEYMGVRVDPVKAYPGDVLEPIEEASWPEGCVVGTSRKGYALDCRVNDSYTAVNRLLQGGANISRTDCEVTCGDIHLPPGTFIVKAKKADIAKVAENLTLAFYAVDGDLGETTPVKAPRIGMYQRYWGGNMDEGWTRFVLESFEFPYTTLMDEEVKKGNLKKKYDAIILPNDTEAMIMGTDLDEYYRKRYGGAFSPPNYPPEYRSGIGDEGVEALKAFVEEGGTLVCFDGACDFAISKLKLKLTNALEGLSSKEFFCPGSTLHAYVNSNHPAAYGMPADSLVFFWNSRAFRIVPSGENDRYEVVATYPERDILESGWLIGGGKMKRKAAMVVAKHGEGRVVLIGFRPQHRAQTHGTYKLVFNSLYG
jgi:hypothetical protein